MKRSIDFSPNDFYSFQLIQWQKILQSKGFDRVTFCVTRNHLTTQPPSHRQQTGLKIDPNPYFNDLSDWLNLWSSMSSMKLRLLLGITPVSVNVNSFITQSDKSRLIPLTGVSLPELRKILGYLKCQPFHFKECRHFFKNKAYCNIFSVCDKTWA